MSSFKEVPGATVITGKGIDAFRLLSLKGRLKLEEKGLKFKGASTRTQLAKEFGLTPRTPRAVYIKAIEDRLAKLEEDFKKEREAPRESQNV